MLGSLPTRDPPPQALPPPGCPLIIAWLPQLTVHVTTKNPSPRPGRSRRPRRSTSSSAAHRVTPISKPTAVPFDVAPHDPTPIEFSALDLDDRLRAGIGDRGFERTTPIQSAVFPIVFAGGDLIACAETGTGKTAAFLLPLMQRLLATPTAGVIRALVLAPTRELAVQIEDDFTGFSYHTSLTSVAVYGGVDGDIQARALRAGTDMVVATPGRLLDHMSTGIVDFGKVEVLVLDEADRMLDMGFWPDVQRIVSSLPPTRQTLLFSATTSSDVVKLAEQVMRDPKMIQVGRAGGPATTIAHVAHVLPNGDKAEWLGDFLRRNRQPTLVFVRTKRFADRLASILSGRGIRCAALHADRTQADRTAAVEGFRAGRFKVLVATDIAARGLDIDGIEHVVNYEVPHSADQPTCTAPGRTGRAEATGTALTLVARGRTAHAPGDRAVHRHRSSRTTNWSPLPRRRRRPGVRALRAVPGSSGDRDASPAAAPAAVPAAAASRHGVPFDRNRAFVDQRGQGADGGEDRGEHRAHHARGQRELGHGPIALLDDDAAHVAFVNERLDGLDDPVALNLRGFPKRLVGHGWRALLH